MGSVCGVELLDASKSNTPEAVKQAPTPSRDSIKPARSQKLKCTSREDVGFCLQTPPILNSKSQLIFISCSGCIRTTRYKVFDLNKDEFIQDEEIKCDNDNDEFDITNTVYTYDPDTNKIYLIEDNKDIKTLDLNKNELISLNKSIETMHNNYAQIECINGQVYVLGAEKITNNDQKNKFVNIPYSLCCKNFNDRQIFKIKEFGKSSTKMIMGSISKAQLICYGFIRSSTKTLFPSVIPIEVYALCYKFYPKQETYVFLMGGLKRAGEHQPNPDKIIATDGIWVADINNLKWHMFGDRHKDSSGYRYRVAGHHTYRHSFGVINYRDKYIFQLGGIEWNWHIRKEIAREKHSNSINVLALTEDNPYNLEAETWYELPLKLLKKASGHIHCVYPTTNNENDIVHIFTYSGRHYTFEIKELLASLGDEQARHHQGHWTEYGKTAMPTGAIANVETIPPVDHGKCEIAPLLKELNLYDKYEDAQELTYGDIIKDDDGDKLSEIVNDQSDLDRIMNAASKLQQIQ